MTENESTLLRALDARIEERLHCRIEDLLSLARTKLATSSILDEMLTRIEVAERCIDSFEREMKVVKAVSASAVTVASLDAYVRLDHKFRERVQQLIDKHTEDESHLAVDDVLESDVFSDTLIATVDERLKDTEWVSMFLATEIARQVRFALEGANFTVACAD